MLNPSRERLTQYGHPGALDAAGRQLRISSDEGFWRPGKVLRADARSAGAIMRQGGRTIYARFQPRGDTADHKSTGRARDVAAARQTTAARSSLRGSLIVGLCEEGQTINFFWRSRNSLRRGNRRARLCLALMMTRMGLRQRRHGKENDHADRRSKHVGPKALRLHLRILPYPQS